SLEKASDHYIAAEIKRRAEKDILQPVKIEGIKAYENGITGRIGEDEVKIGARDFLAKELKTLGSILTKDAPGDNPEHSSVFMSFGGRPSAIFIFGDEIRKGSFTAVDQLRAMGYRIALISGDEDKTTKDIAGKIGVGEACGGRLPRDKVSFISGLQKEGHQVAMVGDGINDALALAQADLAISVHSGSHLGEERAGITLMGGDPGQILDFMGLAKKVNKKIYQNLICSFFYNVLSIPVAMSGLLTPLIAVCAMLLSSLSVIVNTLLLIKGSGTP
ncbi:MAG: HAD-IC family P-type ATPase, partial [Candidatus Binatia bacterium]|nr:HAD-IC family P-type ATPase [Candidatus Binatia bacterium]